MDQIKAKEERRGELVIESKTLFDLAGGEKRDLKADELTRMKAIESEIESIDEQLRALKAGEKRKAEAALLEEQRKQVTTTDAKVGTSGLETVQARNNNLALLFSAASKRNTKGVEDAQAKLKEGGHYRDFNTMVDTQGGIFVPTSVSREIVELEKKTGFIAAHAKSFGNIMNGSLKLPSVLGKIEMYGVSEGAEIAGTTATIGGIELKANKWGGITFWTKEIGDEAGAVLIPMLQRQIAESNAYKKDFVFLRGDGTSTYNNIKGLETMAAAGTFNYVRTFSPTADEDTYSELTAATFLEGINDLAPGARKGGYYVFHPNMELYVRLLQSTSGNYAYATPRDASKDAPTLFGYPVFYTEAATFDPGADKVFGYFVNPDYISYADGRSVTIDMLDQATVKDASGNSVNLALTNSKGLRFTTMWDIKPSNAVVSDAGTTKGAFVVLKTHS